jgi:hypothetical protein
LLHGKDSQTGRVTGNYFEVDGQSLGERNPKWLNDDYVKFIRFAQWRIEQTGYGILAFVTNHGYLDNPTFRGMRQSLMHSFDDIYILDLHGNSKKEERCPDGIKDANVFDIQQGVAISIFIKRQKNKNLSKRANVYHSHLWGEREKYTKKCYGPYSILSACYVAPRLLRLCKPSEPAAGNTPTSGTLVESPFVMRSRHTTKSSRRLWKRWQMSRCIKTIWKRGLTARIEPERVLGLTTHLEKDF